MPKITYVECSGREHRVEVPLGRSVMRGAVDNSIPGIDADLRWRMRLCDVPRLCR